MQGPVRTFIQFDPQPTQADNATDNSAGESCESDEEEEVDGRQGEDDRETGKKTDEESDTSCSEEDSKG